MKDIKSAVCKSCGGTDFKLQIYDVTLQDHVFFNFVAKKLEYKSGAKMKTLNFYRHALAKSPQFNCGNCGMTTAEIEYGDGGKTSDPTQFISDIYDVDLPTPIVFTLAQFNKLKKNMKTANKKAVTAAIKEIKKEIKKDPANIKGVEKKIKAKKKKEHTVEPDWDISEITDLEKKVDDLTKRCPENPSENVWLRRPGGIIFSYRQNLIDARDKVRPTIPKLIKEKFEKNYDKYKEGEILKLKTSMEMANEKLDKIYDGVKGKIKALKELIKERI